MKKLDKLLKRFLLIFIRKLFPRSTFSSPNDWHSFKKILVFRLDNRLGNCVLILPLIQTIKESLPHLHLDVLMTNRFIEIYQNHPSIDRVIPYDQENLLKRPWRFVRLVQRLRHNMYDAVLSSTNPNSFSLSQALFARIILPQRSVGFKWGESEYLYTDVVVGRTNVFYGDAQVDLWRYFDPQAYYKPPRLYFKNDINRSPDKNVLIWLGARGRKVMSEILLSRIVKLLEDMNISYSYAAGPSDKKLVKNYSTQLVQEVEFIQGNLYDTVMFFKRFKLLIMPDTGPMHLAAATDIPLIQVFIDSNIVWYGYKGKNQFILRENDDFQTMAKFIKKHIGTTHIMEQGKILQ